MTWDRRWLNLARHFASWSKDPSTKVGCVIVHEDEKILLSQGFNGLPRGVADAEERMQRPAKYLWTSHAEENAIAHAARVGVSLNGATAYVTHCPCARCARALIQAGIERVVFPAENNGTGGMDPEEFVTALAMLREADVALGELL